MESVKILDAWIDKLGRRITEHASRHLLIKRHLVTDLQINGEMLHPSQGPATPFDGNDRDGKNMLVRGKDFLSSRSGQRWV
jgi:hypothetical protein